MRYLFSRLWVGMIAVAFLLLWAASLGGGGFWPGRLVGIAGWGLVGAGFFGVAVTAALAARPKPPRRLARPAAAPRHPAKVARSAYTPPPWRRYRRNIVWRRQEVPAQRAPRQHHLGWNKGEGF